MNENKTNINWVRRIYEKLAKSIKIQTSFYKTYYIFL